MVFGRRPANGARSLPSFFIRLATFEPRFLASDRFDLAERQESHFEVLVEKCRL